MSFVNSTNAIYVYIGGQNVSDYVIEGSLSDDSVYTNTIITTTGTITLGGSTSILDFDRSQFPIGSRIQVWVQLDNGKIALHPKGTLYVINSSVNAEERTLNLEVGCSLAFITDKEEYYTDAIEGLFDSMLGAVSKEVFVIEQKDLSTLSNFLEVEGSIIYQDQYGNIQKVNAFGADGLGSNISESKLVSYDKYTAIAIDSISESSIEPNVSAVIVESSVSVPGTGSGAEKEPLITSQTFRKVDVATFGPSVWTVGSVGLGLGATEQDARQTRGLIWIEKGEEEELTSENNPGCGTIKEPNVEAEGVGWNLTVQGDVNISSFKAEEKVTAGQYTSNNGPGNQIDREESWEYSSAASWGGTAISNSMNDYAQLVSDYVSEANGLISKANSHFDARDKEPVKKGDDMNPKWVYHNCNAEAFYAQARNVVREAEAAMQNGMGLGGFANGVYAVANLSQTFNYYGEGGELKTKVTNSYAPPATWEGSRAGSVGAGPMPTGPVADPKAFGLKQSSRSTTTYQYEATQTISTEKFEDYRDPTNSYVKISYSSSGSNNPTESDRLQTKNTINGVEYCDQNTDSKEITVKVPTVAPDYQTTGEWFGVPTSSEKTVSLPVEFVPLLPILNPDTQLCESIDIAGGIANYESIMLRYANILAKKITGDNRGFRITEKLRAEVFEYYPFYPVTIVLESLSRAFTARIAASNWVFDSQNAVCSFDCLLSGDFDAPTFIDLDEPEYSYLQAIYPPLTSSNVTSENYGADGGEFTQNTTNDGFDCDGGNLDNGTAAVGITVIEGGDFDSGTAVVLPPPYISPEAPVGNNSADPEAEYGIVVVDPDDDEIPTDTLPEPIAPINPIYPLVLDINVKNYIKAALDVVISETQTWNYGFFTMSLGYNIDMGTINAPNANVYDFGSLTTETDPILASYIS